MGEFEQKSALVLGGSRGIGAAIVHRLARGNVRVSFTYAGSIDQAQKISEETGAEAFRVDSSNLSALVSLIEGMGSLDILVINAGVLLLGDSAELDPRSVDHMFDVNIRAPYHAAVAAARIMTEGGRIIVIGSVNGDRMPFAGGAAYALTKSAMQGMVRGLARDLGSRGITVNNVQPGPTDSDMNPADGPMASQMHSFMAIKRHARSDEIAELVAFIASEKGAMITGSMQTIDGGFGA